MSLLLSLLWALLNCHHARRHIHSTQTNETISQTKKKIRDSLHIFWLFFGFHFIIIKTFQHCNWNSHCSIIVGEVSFRSCFFFGRYVVCSSSSTLETTKKCMEFLCWSAKGRTKFRLLRFQIVFCSLYIPIDNVSRSRIMGSKQQFHRLNLPLSIQFQIQ